MEKALAIRYHERGNPSEVLRAEEIPVEPLKSGEVRVRLLASAVNPSDLGTIAGTYGRLRDLPAVAGREGLGEVVETGNDVESVRVGERVQMPEETGAWQALVNAPAATLVKVPADVPVDQGAMAFVNPPTALRLLEDFVELQPGDWVIQNAANSAVGFALVALARWKGLHTLNVVRDPRWTDPLKAAGGDVVVTEESEYYKKLKTLTGGAQPKLAVNSVGGMSVVGLIRSVAPGSPVVTIGAMTGDSIRFPTRQLIFDDIRLVGFWMDRWYRTHAVAERQEMLNTLFPLIRDGLIRMPVAREYPLAEAVAAVTHASGGGRDGKVLIRG